jgi:hypothetical protein
LLYRRPDLDAPGGWRCGATEPTWETAAATYVAAVLVKEWQVTRTGPELDSARPIECLTCDGQCGDDSTILTWYSQQAVIEPKIQAILSQPPTRPAQRAFRALFSEVLRRRMREFHLVEPGTDIMHSGFPLADHFERLAESFEQGIGHAPSYVQAVLDGDDPSEIRDLNQTAGIVIVRDRLDSPA